MVSEVNDGEVKIVDTVDAHNAQLVFVWYMSIWNRRPFNREVHQSRSLVHTWHTHTAVLSVDSGYFSLFTWRVFWNCHLCAVPGTWEKKEESNRSRKLSACERSFPFSGYRGSPYFRKVVTQAVQCVESRENICYTAMMIWYFHAVFCVTHNLVTAYMYVFI